MSTIASTNIKHPSSATNNITLASTGAVAVNGSMTGAGLDLITPTSIAYSGGTASVSGGKISLTGVNSISINGAFSSTYDIYMLSMSMAHSTGASFLTARLRSSGADATGTNYQYTVGLLYNAFASLSSEYNGTYMRVTRSGDDTTNQGETIMFLRNPGTAAPTSGHADSGYPYTTTFGTRYFGGFWHSLSTAYDGITFFSSSGTISGDIRVYGYKNS